MHANSRTQVLLSIWASAGGGGSASASPRAGATQLQVPAGSGKSTSSGGAGGGAMGRLKSFMSALSGSAGGRSERRSNAAAIASMQQLMARPISSVWTLIMREARNLSVSASQVCAPLCTALCPKEAVCVTRRVTRVTSAPRMRRTSVRQAARSTPQQPAVRTRARRRAAP